VWHRWSQGWWSSRSSARGRMNLRSYTLSERDITDAVEQKHASTGGLEALRRRATWSGITLVLPFLRLLLERRPKAALCPRLSRRLSQLQEAMSLRPWSDWIPISGRRKAKARQAIRRLWSSWSASEKSSSAWKVEIPSKAIG
jgi:hypothetical protein